MTNFSHIQTQLEEQEASLSVEERADRDRSHQEALEKLMNQQEQLMAPFRRIEQLLAPFRAVEAALDSLRFAEQLKRQMGLSPVLETLKSASATIESLTLYRKAQEECLGGAWQTALAACNVMRTQNHAIQNALSSAALLKGHVHLLAASLLRLPLAAELARFETGESETFSAESTSFEGEGSSDELPTEMHVECAPKKVNRAPSRPSLKERRLTAYYVLLDGVRCEPKGSPILDDLVDRLLAARNAMIRDVENGRY